MEEQQQNSSGGMGKIIVAVVVLVILAAGVYIYMSQQKMVQNALDATNPQPSVSPAASVESSSTDSAQTDQVKEFTVVGAAFKFDPSTITVNKGDKVKITFKNGGGTHDLVIDEFNVTTKVIKTGEEDTVEFTADKAGSFEYYCSVEDHRAKGMKGTLIVK